jgi:hypothetical protein
VPDYLFLMHNDLPGGQSEADWDTYITGLRAADVFRGGSSIGDGMSFRRAGAPLAAQTSLTGFIRIQAPDLGSAQAFLTGNPVYEAGGTVEIRELPEE